MALGDVDANLGCRIIGGTAVKIIEADPGADSVVLHRDPERPPPGIMAPEPRHTACDSHRRDIGRNHPAGDRRIVDFDNGRQVGFGGIADGEFGKGHSEGNNGPWGWARTDIRSISLQMPNAKWRMPNGGNDHAGCDDGSTVFQAAWGQAAPPMQNRTH